MNFIKKILRKLKIHNYDQEWVTSKGKYERVTSKKKLSMEEIECIENNIRYLWKWAKV